MEDLILIIAFLLIAGACFTLFRQLDHLLHSDDYRSHSDKDKE